MPARQLARVAADEETWRAFRQAALVRGVSVAAYLGELVGAELNAEVQRVSALVDEVQNEFDAGNRELRMRLRRVPGMPPTCARCGGPLRLHKTRYGRRKHQWASSWNCLRCRVHHSPDEV